MGMALCLRCTDSILCPATGGLFFQKTALSGEGARKQTPVSRGSVDRACSRSHWLSRHTTESLSRGSRAWKWRMNSLREGVAKGDGITRGVLPRAREGLEVIL